MQSDFIKICEKINRNYLAGETVNDSTIAQFIRSAYDLIHSDDYDSLTEPFDEICYLSEMFWRIKSDCEVNPKISFQMGQVFSLTRIIKIAKDEKNHKNDSQEIYKIIQNYNKVFYVIERFPGFTHTELAEKLEMDKSRLSQILKIVFPYGLFVFRQTGTRKFYYLTDKYLKLKKEICADRSYGVFDMYFPKEFSYPKIRYLIDYGQEEKSFPIRDSRKLAQIERRYTQKDYLSYIDFLIDLKNDVNCEGETNEQEKIKAELKQ